MVNYYQQGHLIPDYNYHQQGQFIPEFDYRQQGQGFQGGGFPVVSQVADLEM